METVKGVTEVGMTAGELKACIAAREKGQDVNNMDDVTADIPQGKLQGKHETSVFGTDFFSFQKIPYAKPPVGELRFKPPLPAEGWTGVRDATQEGPVSCSFDRLRNVYNKNGSEDCLYVNVYCKQNPSTFRGKKYPVMVWIHGGGFEFGTGNRTFAGPDYLLLHEVILVTFNYRLGVLGFLSLQTLECPGNFGLKDQQLALKWVKKNISHFGGDPDNITLFGVSAGAASIHYHILCPQNKGLFKRAIMQSGSALNRWGYARKPRENAFVLGKRLGCDTTEDNVLLDFLKKTPAEDLVIKGLKVVNETEGVALGESFLNFTFVPAVEPQHDGAVLTKHPWLLLKEGKFLDVPLITGMATHEMILGVVTPDDYPRFKTDEEYQQLIPRELQEDSVEQSVGIAKCIQEFYFEEEINLDNYVNLLSDTFFNYGIYRHIKARATGKNLKSPTYLYLFSYDGEQPFLKRMLGLGGIKGASHGDDMMYLLKTDLFNQEKIRPGMRDYIFMWRLTKLWTTFSATGVPKLDEPGFKWKPTTLKDLEYMNLGERLVMEKDLIRNRMEFWDEMYNSFYDRDVTKEDAKK